MLSREQVRAELLAAYRRRGSDGFAPMLLRGVSDPLQPLTEARRRRFHPLLITAALLLALCLAIALIFSR